MKKTASTKAKTAALGANDLITFIHDWGHPEWVVLAVEAPLEQVSSLYARLHSATERLPDVPVRVAEKRDKEIAPLVAVVQPSNSSWTVIFRVLCLPIDERDFTQANRDAQMLSSKLKSRALAFLGEDTSYAMGFSLYQRGKEVAQENWEDQTDPVDKPFAALGLYLPACYPCRRGSNTWLATTNSSLGRVERADLINLEPLTPKPRSGLSAREAKKLAAALNRAARAGSVRLMQKLVAAGADPDQSDDTDLAWEGFRPLISAAAKGHLEAVRFLLAAGASVNLQVDAASDWNGATALMMACYHGHSDAVKHLLKAGADLNVNAKEPGSPTAIQYAAEKGRLEILRLLLRAGAALTRLAVSRAVKRAVWPGDLAPLKELLKNRRPGSIPFGPGTAALAIKADINISLTRRIEVLKMLLAAGADINGDGAEALRTAIRQEDPALVKFLLEAGADVNASGTSGSTPLHYAAFLGQAECAKLLLHAGARLDARNSDGKTPLEWAKFHDRKEMAKLLQDAEKRVSGS